LTTMPTPPGATGPQSTKSSWTTTSLRSFEIKIIIVFVYSRLKHPRSPTPA
jgi:hypothetical protein